MSISSSSHLPMPQQTFLQNPEITQLKEAAKELNRVISCIDDAKAKAKTIDVTAKDIHVLFIDVFKTEKDVYNEYKDIFLQI